MDSNAKVTFYIKVILLLVLLSAFLLITRTASGLDLTGEVIFTTLPM